MDFVELEAIEGLRWSWNSWPVSKSESSALIIPLSIMCTPLMKFNELPILPYDPLICIQCGAVLNPYARVDYQSRIWICPFCYRKNPFPKSYLGINENNIPAELFPTYSTVEYHLGKKGLAQNSNSSSLLSKMNSFSGLDWAGNGVGGGPAFVFVVDGCTSNEELRVVKNELLHVIAQLPENALVGLVVFDSMVRVYDLGFGECCRVVMFHGERDLSSEQVQCPRPVFLNYTGGKGFSSEFEFELVVIKNEFIFGLNSNSSSLLSKMNSFSGLDWAGNGFGGGPAFVFIVDGCTSNEELRVVKSELLHVIAQLPENVLVGLVVFDSMVRVYDLGFVEYIVVNVLIYARDIVVVLVVVNVLIYEQTKEATECSSSCRTTVEKFCDHKRPAKVDLKKKMIIDVKGKGKAIEGKKQKEDPRCWKKGLVENPNSRSNFGKVSSLEKVPLFSSLDLVGYGVGLAIVFVMDGCTANEELRVVRNEPLHVIAQLPSLVGGI
ncbi:putative magnesium transporter MRS2-I-like [Capsicum annuum]|nr:putative magnesium transporter MRS2-I-like [Capsicum annuum]